MNNDKKAEVVQKSNEMLNQVKPKLALTYMNMTEFINDHGSELFFKVYKVCEMIYIAKMLNNNSFYETALEQVDKAFSESSLLKKETEKPSSPAVKGFATALWKITHSDKRVKQVAQQKEGAFKMYLKYSYLCALASEDATLSDIKTILGIVEYQYS